MINDVSSLHVSVCNLFILFSEIFVSFVHKSLVESLNVLDTISLLLDKRFAKSFS